MATATREEIIQHLDSLNAAWQRFDALESIPAGGQKTYGDELQVIEAKNEANREYVAALAWLAENGIPGASLAHNASTLTFSVDDATLSLASN